MRSTCGSTQINLVDDIISTSKGYFQSYWCRGMTQPQAAAEINVCRQLRSHQFAFKQLRDGHINDIIHFDTIFDQQWQNATCLFTLSPFSLCSPVSEVAPSLENLSALSRLTKINAGLIKGMSLTQRRYANLWQSEASRER